MARASRAMLTSTSATPARRYQAIDAAGDRV